MLETIRFQGNYDIDTPQVGLVENTNDPKWFPTPTEVSQFELTPITLENVWPPAWTGM